MKKIKITESQASLLGLDKVSESDESGVVKSVGTSIGDKVVRIAISGPSLPTFKERILQVIIRQDPDAKVNFFDATGKIVGTVKDFRLDSIKRDIKSLDPTIEVLKSDPSKKLVKITKEQYNRIFAAGVINESEVKGGLNRVDKSFKKEFAGKDIKNLKSVAEDEKFNINKPNPSIPKLSKNVGNRKDSIKENEGGDIKKEALELIKYLYRKSEELSPFWEKNGFKYGDICKVLLEKNIIIDKDGKYELSKALGSPQAAKQKLEDELNNLLQSKGKGEVEPQEAEIEEYDNYNYPAGADADPNAPWNEEDPDIREPKVPENPQLTVLASNNDIAILKDPKNVLYVFHFAFKDKEEFAEYAPVIRKYVGKDEDGRAEYEYDTNFDIDGEVISNFVNDKLKELSKGDGIAAWNEGVDLVKIDEPVKQEILKMFDKDKNVVKALGGVNEVDAIDKFKSSVKKNFTPSTEPSSENPEDRQSRIKSKLADLKGKEDIRVSKEKTDNEELWKDSDIDEADKVFSEKDVEVYEMTGAASSGAFTGPLGGGVVKREMPDIPVVGETTVGGAGNFQYDAPGLANVGRNGEFKNGSKTKAEKSTQYSGGSFVKLDSCTKLNNNKSAQNGKCSQGATDGVVKQVKSKSSIISPSLSEEIYVKIANKTGKSIEEVKNIIEVSRKHL